jgi:excinuclease ABC subunit C
MSVMNAIIPPNEQLINQVRQLPGKPGVYLFKDSNDQIVYIGKAKHLKKRVSNYVQNLGRDVKADTIFQASVNLEHIETKNELEAMLLEAKLIQSHQPKCNILLKSGQPFLYILATSGKTPELKLVRNQKQKGVYFGPFLEKTSARRVFDFLIKTFRLKLCKSKIANGCLNYHMGICAGSCRPDFDLAAYQERFELAKASLKQGHKKFLGYLKEQIEASNRAREFEKSKQLHEYYQAFERVFSALDVKPSDSADIVRKDIWILTPDGKALFVFEERDAVLKKKHVFYFPLAANQVQELSEDKPYIEYFLSYYRTFVSPSIILINFDLDRDDKKLYEGFLKSWHQKEHDVTIIKPEESHFASLVRVATIQVQQELEKQVAVPKALKTLFKLAYEPHTIDCFDISHKQGMFMVGSCVRFKDGHPDKEKFRLFHIRTVAGQDDYASLREIVQRRYADPAELPDLILIDGGKGQLNAVQDLFPLAEFASLAKREETVFSKRLPEGRVLDQKSFVGQLLIALRDYTHHFAISFHRKIEKL